MLVVAFVGLPCAGKSTVINSIAGKRVLQSGVCRTTTVATIVGTKDAGVAGAMHVSIPAAAAALVSDDGVEFGAIDLPGIADAENTGLSSEGNFTALALKWASQCDVVVWVTDARTAFLTTHETREFTDMRSALEKIADEDGKLFQFCILLAKYETDESIATGAAGAAGSIKARAGEITRPTEHSTIEDHEARIRGLTGHAVVLFKFSAHNRIAHSSSASAALKAMVLSSPGSTRPTAHTTFNLKWATDGLPERRLAQMKRALCAAKIRAAASSTYRTDVDASITALAGSSIKALSGADFLELGQCAAYAAAAAIFLIAICIVMCLVRLCVSSVKRAPTAVLLVVVWLCFLALYTSPGLSPQETNRMRHERTSPSERAEAGDPGIWYLKLADQGKPIYAREQYELGKMYHNGNGVELNLTKAVKWYRESAEQSNADAQLWLGRMYHNGNGVALDLSEAAGWYRKAAEQGNADAQFWLGHMRRIGNGVALDLTEAAGWYRKAAEQGNADAQFALGNMYRDGKGVELDLTEAAGWYRKSAEQGNALSQFWLGTMYYDGKGVELDLTEAAKWYERAKSAN
jgi:hypothetical protein